MYLFKKSIWLAASLLALGLAGFAQQTFQTTVYFDYSTFITTDGYLTSNALTNKFHFRRAYFNYENKISDNLKFRFRYDADNTANLTSVDFAKQTVKKDDKLRPFVKHIFLEYGINWLQSKFNVGLIETMAFKLSEDRRGLRSVAKTFADGYKDITGEEIDMTSADLGVTWKGVVSKEIRFGLGVHNGSHYSHVEADKYKKFSGYVQIVPVNGVSLVGYADLERQAEGKDAVTYKIDALLNLIPKANVVFEWLQYDTDLKTYKSGGWSAYATYQITPDKFGLFFRYDNYQPNLDNSDKDQSLIIAGFDWAAWGKTCRIQPNVWIYNYKNSAKKGDVVGVVTFFMTF
jgi:hypothetical protein